jgi:flagellar motor switch protein FliM
LTVERFNFKKPGPLAGELEHRLGAWLRGACALAPQQWGKSFAFAASVAFAGVDTSCTEEALGQLPETVVAYRVALKAGSLVTLFCLPRPLVLVLLEGLLGDAGEALPDDRTLTPVEDWLWQNFLRQLWLPPLAETWAGQEPLTLELLQKEAHARWSRAFGTEEKVVVCTLKWTGPFGDQTGWWLFPQKGLLQLLGGGTPKAALTAATAAPLPQRLEGLVRDLPVEISVVLGTAQVPLPDLSGLRAGDVVVLDQRVTEPLPILVGGEQKFLGWPGRVGEAQAFQIASLVGG